MDLMTEMIIKSKMFKLHLSTVNSTYTKNSELLGTFTMAVFGLHDISNAAAAIALADLNGISIEKNSRIT